MEGPRETMRRFAQQGQTDGVRGSVRILEGGGLGRRGAYRGAFCLRRRYEDGRMWIAGIKRNVCMGGVV